MSGLLDTASEEEEGLRMDPVDQQLFAQLVSAAGFGVCDHGTLSENQGCLEGDQPDEMEQKHLCQQTGQPGEESLN